MRVTCSQCEKAYSIPGEVLGDDGRHMRCGECGTRWWQAGEGSTMLAKREDRGSRTLIVSDNGGYREEPHGFTSFFDGISNRFTAQGDERTMQSSQRFERLRHSRQQRRLRDSNAIVEAEFREIRDFAHVRDWCRTWLPRIVVIALFVASIVLVLVAA